MPRTPCKICGTALPAHSWTPTICSESCVEGAAGGAAPHVRPPRAQLTLEEAWARAPPQPAAAAAARVTTLDAFTAEA